MQELPHRVVLTVCLAQDPAWWEMLGAEQGEGAARALLLPPGIAARCMAFFGQTRSAAANRPLDVSCLFGTSCITSHSSLLQLNNAGVKKHLLL